MLELRILVEIVQSHFCQPGIAPVHQQHLVVDSAELLDFVDSYLHNSLLVLKLGWTEYHVLKQKGHAPSTT